MKVAVISDIHAKIDDSAVGTNMLYNGIRNLLQENDKVILNGDIFDCMVGKSWKDTEQNTRKLLQKYKKLAQLIAKDNRIIYVRGNHDCTIKSKVNMYNIPVYLDYEITNSRGERFRFSHGHNVDPLIKNKITRWISNIGTNLLNRWILRKKGLDFELQGWARKISNICRFNNKTYLKYCKKLFNDNPDIVFQCFGHTHIPSWNVIDTKYGKRHYINCGAGINYRDDCLIIDTEKKVYTLYSLYATKLTNKRIAQIKKGDVLAVFDTGSIGANIISDIFPGISYDISHLALCKSNKKCIEATLKGVVENNIHKYKSSHVIALICRPNDRNKEKINNMIDYAESKIGSKYSYKQILYIFYSILRKYVGMSTKSIDIDSKKYTCSELVAEAFYSVYSEYIYKNVRPAMTHPFHIVVSDKFYTVAMES